MLCQFPVVSYQRPGVPIIYFQQVITVIIVSDYRPNSGRELINYTLGLAAVTNGTIEL
jgi:hypothetical protein